MVLVLMYPVANVMKALVVDKELKLKDRHAAGQSSDL